MADSSKKTKDTPAGLSWGDGDPETRGPEPAAKREVDGVFGQKAGGRSPAEADDPVASLFKADAAMPAPQLKDEPKAAEPGRWRATSRSSLFDNEVKDPPPQGQGKPPSAHPTPVPAPSPRRPNVDRRAPDPSAHGAGKPREDRGQVAPELDARDTGKSAKELGNAGTLLGMGVEPSRRSSQPAGRERFSTPDSEPLRESGSRRTARPVAVPPAVPSGPPAVRDTPMAPPLAAAVPQDLPPVPAGAGDASAPMPEREPVPAEPSIDLFGDGSDDAASTGDDIDEIEEFERTRLGSRAVGALRRRAWIVGIGVLAVAGSAAAAVLLGVVPNPMASDGMARIEPVAAKPPPPRKAGAEVARETGRAQPAKPTRAESPPAQEPGEEPVAAQKPTPAPEPPRAEALPPAQEPAAANPTPAPDGLAEGRSGQATESPRVPTRAEAPEAAAAREVAPAAAEDGSGAKAEPSSARGSGAAPAEAAHQEELDVRRAVVVARQRLAEGKAKEVEARMREVLESHPINHHVMDMLARALIEQGHGREAVIYARLAVARRTKRARYRVALGDALMLVGNAARARAEWKKALQFEPDHRGVQRRLRQ